MMSIYAIGDLHLSFSEEVIPGRWDKVVEHKPMGRFGPIWDKHYQKLFTNWNKIINDRDLVLLPGDISWAGDLEEAVYDFQFLDSLPGKKVMVRGNHDYWWQGIKKMRLHTPVDWVLIQNDSFHFDGVNIAGTRGWTVPNHFQFDEHDQKIYQRELIRLKLSLDGIEHSEDMLIVMLHYMPVNEAHEKNELIQLLEDYQVDICLYGHLHGVQAHQTALNGERWGIEFRLVSADFLNFQPALIRENQPV